MADSVRDSLFFCKSREIGVKGAICVSVETRLQKNRLKRRGNRRQARCAPQNLFAKTSGMIENMFMSHRLSAIRPPLPPRRISRRYASLVP